MTGIKISALPVSGAVLGADIYPAVQGGITVKQTITQLTTFMNANVVLGSIAQVTGLPAALAGFLPLSGGTMTGVIDMGNHKIINLTDPTNPQDSATKAYVDTFASGFTVILAAYAASTANISATQAGAGIGATLTDNSGTFAVFSVDSVSPPLNSRILFKNQTLSQHNGVYVLTTNGDGISIPWQVTRATDYDTAAQIKPGTLVAVNNGTVNATTSWLETATVVTVDTDPILFSQFTFAPSAFFQIANNLSEGVPATMRTNLGLTGAATMTLPVSAANGGTGISNANTITLGGNVLTAGALTLAGAFAATFTFTAGTSVTFPTSGTLLTSAQPTINQPNIVGTTTNDNAAAGSVGEFISSVILVAAGVSLVNSTSKNITSITLTAGDWDVWGNGCVVFTGVNATTVFWQNTVSASLPDFSKTTTMGVAATGTNINAAPIPAFRYSLAGNQTIFLSADCVFSSGTAKASGALYARRIR
jgi:hypothetical protein